MILLVQVVPSRKVRKAGQAGKPAGGYSGPAADEDAEPAAPFDPDALLPRTDISNQITSKLVANIGSANWKERNAALEEVEEIVKAAGGRIQPTVGDLMPALKVDCNVTTCLYLTCTRTQYNFIAILRCRLKHPDMLLCFTRLQCVLLHVSGNATICKQDVPPSMHFSLV